MNFQVTQEALAEALNVVSRVVPNKSTLPILTNVLVDASADGKLTITSTNLDLSVRHVVDATVKVAGRTTLPAKIFGDYVALLDKGTTVAFDLNAKTQKMHLECNRQIANISGIDPADWPETPITGAIGKGTQFNLSAGVLKAAIDQVAFAAAPDDSRPVLAGVLLKITNDSLAIAAADGFRLAVRTILLPDPTPDVTVIIPAKTMVELGRNLPDVDADNVLITIGATGNSIHFAFGATEVTSRLIEGQFPDYERIIPMTHKTTARISTALFLRATRAASVFSRDNSNIVTLDCAPEDHKGDQPLGVMLVKSTSAEQGDNKGTLEATVVGEAGLIAFNGRYLRDVLEALETAEMTLEISGPSSPGVLRPYLNGDPDPDGMIHVIMPMHIAR